MDTLMLSAEPDSVVIAWRNHAYETIRISHRDFFASAIRHIAPNVAGHAPQNHPCPSRFARTTFPSTYCQHRRVGYALTSYRLITRFWKSLYNENGTFIEASTMQQFSHTLRHHYHLHDCIATTDRGAVYYAERHDDQTPVAVKMLAVDQQADPQWLKRFQMEAVIAFRLKHERIVPLLDYWSDDDGVWLVMRWMAGGSLRQRLKTHGAMSPEEVLVMLQDLCGALARAHQHHIVHRDIKPDNILFDEAGNAYLTDFGVAKRLKAKDITET
jgi:serine/threonine protein kinase